MFCLIAVIIGFPLRPKEEGLATSMGEQFSHKKIAVELWPYKRLLQFNFG